MGKPKPEDRLDSSRRLYKQVLGINTAKINPPKPLNGQKKEQRPSKVATPPTLAQNFQKKQQPLKIKIE